MISFEALIVLNRLVVKVSVLRSSTINALTVLRPDGTVQFAYPYMEEADQGTAAMNTAGRVFNKQNAVFNFISEPLELSLLASLAKSSFVVELVVDGETHRLSGTPGYAGLADIGSLGSSILSRVEVSDDLGPLVNALVGGHIGQIESLPLHIDYAYAENGCLLLNGWMANFAYLDVYVLVNGCAFAARSKDAIIHNRPDVTDHLRGQSALELQGDGHGYSISVDCLDASQPITIGLLKNGVFYVVSQQVPPASGDRGQIFQLLLGARQGTSFTPLDKITRMLTPFLRSNVRSLDYDVISQSRWSRGEAPRLSIIVPFYREWRFLYSLLAMIKRAPLDFEWVIVCDDASIFPQMNLQVSNQLENVRRRITFVLPRQNVGYGHANNIGVEVAKAPRVLLMNSDIWLKRFDVLEFGLQALDDEQTGLIGFTLLFEDGTVQHDGLSFKRSVEVGDRFLALHPGKGLPARVSKERFELVEAQAVTGALMLLERDRFIAIGGFADRYIGGDFEDADLCLTLRQEGFKVGLVRSADIFHLERQSIRHDSANSVGFARTLVNCERFNRRWADTLDTDTTSILSHKDKHLTVVT
jgi:GT2 family glycosyltransferase